MFLTLLPLVKRYAKDIIFGVVILFLAGWIFLRPNPKPVVTQTTPNTVTVQVPVDHLVTKDVVKYVQDDANVKKLLAENAKLKVQVAQLNETLAKSVSTGGGTVATVPTNTLPPDVQPKVSPNTPAESVYNFTDYRLNFAFNPITKDAKYRLTQQFEVLNTTGRDKNGTPVSLTKLFEIGPGDKRTEITDTKTTSVFADDSQAHWHVGVTLQAGIGYGVKSADTKSRGPAAIAGVQWLKRGKTEAAEDSTLSLLTPVLIYQNQEAEFGLLPVSVNLGRIKHQPFKDLWLSPYVGYNAQSGTKLGKIGIVFTASF